MSNTVAIVGRPNVGKSTLFNRLTQEKHAIVHESSGVTRDRHYGKSSWNGVDFSVIDTGGYIKGSEDIFEEEIRKQVEIAIEESDLILFVVDVTTGITDLDDAVTNILRRTKKPVLVVVNKVDNNKLINDAYEFYSLGLGEIYNISSANGSGTGDMLDALVEAFPEEIPFVEDSDIPRFAVVGRPNVGKSSLINALVGEERNIVTAISGTTRDTIHTRYNKFGHDFILTDTAGLRKKAKVNEDIEFYSTLRTVRAIENSDICLLMIDAKTGIESQDLNIYGIIQKNKKGVVVLVNKWDLIEKETNTIKELEADMREKLAPFTDVPIVFISVLEKQRIFKALETAIQVFKNRKTRIPSSQLNDVMLEEIAKFPPPSKKGRYIRIKYVTQLPTHVPSFAFFCNHPDLVVDSYKRFLENKIRSFYNFNGVPIQIFLRKK